MSFRETRLAENESFFRTINERLEALEPESAETLIILCECADPDCSQRLTLLHTEYDAVRADGAQFVVAHGHSHPEIESVVSRTDRFEVVRKRGVAGAVAEHLDTSDEAQPG
jgi:hypothetical protein